MFVSLTRASTGAEPIENAKLVAEEMHRWLADIEGYHGFVMLTEEGTAIGVTFWESRQIAEQHRSVRLQFIERMAGVAGVQIEDISEYDVAFADLPALTT